MGKLGSYLREKLSYFDLNRRAEKAEKRNKTLDEISEIGKKAAAYIMAYQALFSIYDTPTKETEQLLRLAEAVADVTITGGSEAEKSLRENELIKYVLLLKESHAKEATKT